MIISIDDIKLENLPEGSYKVSKLTAGDVCARLAQARGRGRITCCFGFSPVPNDRKDRVFGELLEAMKVDGIELDAKEFFLETGGEAGDDSTFFPIPLVALKIAPDRPMIAISYGLSPGSGGLRDLHVSSSSLTYKLIEMLPAG